MNDEQRVYDESIDGVESMQHERNGTLLIVDDAPSILTSMSKLLAPFYCVRAANSGERALEVVLTEPRPDLILLDVVMPGIDGYTVLNKLKSNPATEDIPVIFVTAMENPDDEEKGLFRGAVDYITKPIIPAILLARVKTHITLKQAHDFLYDKNDYLEKEVVRRMQENQLIQNVSIRALAHLAETRDPETGQHILRTQAYVRIIAKYLKDKPRFNAVITDHYIDLLTKSAPLHDIGKVGIPDYVLLKPGRLDADEWEIMKTHSEMGASAIERAESDIAHPVDFFVLAKEIAHWHHEKWNGKGYPDGLVGDEIPISARIMAVADVFDAIISARVYKEPLPYSEALSIIKRERGEHFDPDVADAFVSCFDQFVEVAKKYREIQ